MSRAGGSRDSAHRGLREANRNGFEVTPRQSAVGWKALREYQYVAFLLCKVRIVTAQESADIGEGIFFGGHRAAVSIAEHFTRNIDGGGVFVAGLMQFYKKSVFGEAACIDIKGNARSSRDATDLANIGHRDRLATSRVVGDRDHDERDSSGPSSLISFSNASVSILPLKG